MNSTKDHYDEDTLEAYAAGLLEEAIAIELEIHVADCHSCAERAAAYMPLSSAYADDLFTPRQHGEAWWREQIAASCSAAAERASGPLHDALSAWADKTRRATAGYVRVIQAAAGKAAEFIVENLTLISQPQTGPQWGAIKTRGSVRRPAGPTSRTRGKAGPTLRVQLADGSALVQMDDATLQIVFPNRPQGKKPPPILVTVVGPGEQNIEPVSANWDAARHSWVAELPVPSGEFAISFIE